MLTMTDSVRPALVAKLCSSGSCPAVYRRDGDTVIVQGYAVTPVDAGVETAPGELLVEVPAALLMEAAKALS
jgi:hypothetical protein